jgi:hypothetical protein
MRHFLKTCVFGGVACSRNKPPARLHRGAAWRILERLFQVPLSGALGSRPLFFPFAFNKKIKTMKTASAIIGLCIACSGIASAQTNQLSTTNASAVKPASTNEIKIVLRDYFIDRSGRHYANAKVVSLKSDYVELSFTDWQGTNCDEIVKISKLPDDVQESLGYVTNSMPSSSYKNMSYDEKIYYYNSTMERRQDEAAAAAAQAAAEEQAMQDALKEREVEAKEAEAAKPPIQVNQQQNTIIW